MARWLVDGNNVMGSRPDGWWRDRTAGMQRLVEDLEVFASSGEEVAVVFDGPGRDVHTERVDVAFASHADDVIAARAVADLTVITSDRELADRARRAGAEVAGAAAFLRRLAAAGGGEPEG